MRKLDADLQGRLVKSIKAGVPPRISAAAVGITWKTFVVWMQRGQAGQEHYRDLYAQVTTSLAAAKERLIGCISAAASEDWKAAKELLQIRWPAEFVPPDVREHVQREFTAFFSRLERRLPRDVYDLVLQAASESDDDLGDREDTAIEAELWRDGRRAILGPPKENEPSGQGAGDVVPGAEVSHPGSSEKEGCADDSTRRQERVGSDRPDIPGDQDEA